MIWPLLFSPNFSPLFPMDGLFFLFFKHTQLLPPTEGLYQHFPQVPRALFPRISIWMTSCHQHFISLTMASSVNLMSPSMSTTWLSFIPIIVSITDILFIDLFSSAHVSPLEHKLFENRDTVYLVYHYFLHALEEYLAQSGSSNNIC